jgi:methyltransferase (TIGR00027 family)
MARTDSDSWEITESVGKTALVAAALRAAETESENPLISDPFAGVFLNVAPDAGLNWFAAAEVPAEIAELAPDLKPRMKGLVDYMAVRTAFFDQFFLDATRAGVRQVAILAAGLDSRSWRLRWPDGVTVYELDLPQVLEFKSRTLREYGARPTCNLVNVPVDLRHDWPAALQQAGFDASAPSAWSVEGLLMFLPAAAQELLFERVQELGATGSRIVVEAPGENYLDDARATRRETMQRTRDLAAKLQLRGGMPDFHDLWYFEEREDAASALDRHGWDVTVTPAAEVMAGYGRRPPQDIAPKNRFVAAHRGLNRSEHTCRLKTLR